MKNLILFIVISLSLFSCGDKPQENKSSVDNVKKAVAEFNANIEKYHPDLGSEDRELLSQYVLSHVMRGEKLPNNLVIDDAIRDQKKVNKMAAQIK